MAHFWSDFLRRTARGARSGAIRAGEGIEAAWVHSALPITNGSYLTSPATDAADLARRMAAANEDALPHQLPWGFFLYEPYRTALTDNEVASCAANAGLARYLSMEVMTGDVADLLPPARPAAEDLSFQPVAGVDDARTALELNLLAYGMPLEIADSVLAAQAFFQDPSRDFGFVASAGGQPVSTSTVVEMDGWLYVALVATHPDHRQRGYAEAVMRHALKHASAATGITRTALDASQMGAPVYQRMGYRFTGEAWWAYFPG